MSRGKGINKALSSTQSGIEAQKGGMDGGERRRRTLEHHSFDVVVSRQLCELIFREESEADPTCRRRCHL